MGVRESVSARGVWRERATVADVVVTTTVGAWARACVWWWCFAGAYFVRELGKMTTTRTVVMMMMMSGRRPRGGLRGVLATMMESRAYSGASASSSSSSSSSSALSSALSSKDTVYASRFRLTREDAKTALRAWLRAETHRPFAARGVGESQEIAYTKTYVPYWVFDVEAEVSYVGGVDVHGELVKSYAPAETLRFDEKSSATQICASFQHRRDYVDALVPGRYVNFATSEDTWDVVREDVLSKDAEAQPFTMKRSMALSLAAVRMRDAVRARATEALMKKHKNALGVSDVVIDFVTIKRRVRAVYHPVWRVDFAHGAVVNDETNKIIQQPRRAMICAVSGVVLSDDLVCTSKARAFAFGAVSLPAILIALAWPDAGLAALGQGAVAAGVAAAGAGVFARQYPQMMQDKIDAVRVREEDRAFNLAMRSPGNADWMDESVQRRRDDAEWRRWMETDKMTWDPVRRAEWAHNILDTQIYRFRERQELRHELDERAQQAEEAERRNAEKERKWGPDWQRDGPRQNAGRHPGYSRDIHGFYKTLRLEDKLGLATEEEIKAAFRVVAHETHPDKVTGDAAAKKRAAERFQLAQKAYKTLASKKTRAAYDRK